MSNYARSAIDHAVHRSLAGVDHHALQKAVAWISQIVDALKSRRKLHHMLNFEPHLLDDIGIDQFDILSALNCPWYRNPAEILQQYRHRNLRQQKQEHARMVRHADRRSNNEVCGTQRRQS